jgi:hypothetical protein
MIILAAFMVVNGGLHMNFIKYRLIPFFILLSLFTTLAQSAEYFPENDRKIRNIPNIDLEKGPGRLPESFPLDLPREAGPQGQEAQDEAGTGEWDLTEEQIEMKQKGE